MPLSPDKVPLNKYRILRLIGEGGMARVWLAEQIDLPERPVAIKETKDDLISFQQNEIQTRYRHELEIYTRLENVHAPNVIRIYTTERFENKLLLIMEYMSGGDLATRLKNSPQGLSIEESIDVICSILEALDAAHNHPLEIIHRDIKPLNILFNALGTAL